ncbi:fibronectin type III domain-containing protein [Roseivirga sp. BDSF3-8]|uniref:fibronectin type III domain-containing protein n=1 Tax=Roseivirga sp. BDSF3-8 TaxID=3241598 RepID=UPI0035325875
MMKERPFLRLWVKVWVCMLCLLGVFGQASAQSAVQASLQIFPPHSVYLSHYSQPGSLQVQILLRDMTEPSYPVHLRWTIEGPGIRLSTRQGYQGNVITLQGGMPRLLSAPELAGGLSPDALDFSGYDRGQFAQSGGQLPEGFYRFTVQAYDFRRPDVPLSAPATATAWLVLADPPLLNLPACHSQVTWPPGQPLLFQWTPMHRGSGLSGIAYEFTLVEVRGGLPPEEAMRSLPPLYQTVTPQTSLTYGLELPPLQEGLTYAWRVRAQLDDPSLSRLDARSEETFKNQGYSRVCAFVPGTPVADLPPLSGLTAEALSHVHARFSFAGYHRDNRRSQASTYRLQYRPTHQPDWPWRSVDITDTVYIARELAPDTPYEVKAGVVRNGIASQWSQVTAFTTQAPPEQACYDDEGPLPEITNREPLPNALVGDQIAVGKFTMRLQEVRGGDGVFSGRGTIYVPWMGLTLPVQFDRIAINTDYRMTDGLVHALSKPLDEWREGIEDFWEDRQQLADTTITVSGYLETVTLKEPAEGNNEATTDSRTYVVTLASGETIEIQQPPGQSVAVTDSQGRTIVIDEEGRIGPILEPEADTPVLATGDRISQPVYFTAYEHQHYGFDTQLHDAYTEHYESLPLSEDENSEYPIAWKALATGQTDRVTLKGDTTGLKLITQSGQPVPVLEKTGDDLYTILLTGQGDKEESYLQAIRTNAEDSTESLSGQLNTVSYAPQQLTLKVVPVNGAGYMKPGGGKDILKALKATYGPAVVNSTVIYDDAFTADYDTDGDGALDDGSTGMLSNYTPEMRKLIRSYEQAHKTEDGTYYLFLVHTPKSAIDEDGTDNARAGFMPYKRQFGFIFTSRIGNPDHFDKTIAHELGHGAFRLPHTFVETPALEEWATDNLMDYTFFGTQLHKHQWDLIHNPRPVWGLLTGDEEVSAFGEGPGGICLGDEEAIRTLNSRYTHFYLPDGRILDTRGSLQVSGFFPYSADEPQATRGTVFSLRPEAYDYTHVYTSTEEKNTTYGFGLKITSTGLSTIKAENLTLPESSDKAVRVRINKEGRAIDVLDQAGSLVETIPFTRDCACNEVTPSEAQTFAFDDHTSHYVDKARDLGKPVTGAIHHTSEIIHALLASVNAQKPTHAKDEAFLGHILADKLLTYEAFNEGRKFYVAPVEVNTLSLSQASWDQVARTVFEEASLTADDILITVPYVRCSGIGNDLGEYFFMPGLAYGDNIRIDHSQLKKGQYKNTQRVASFQAGIISPVEDFVVDVFRHTAKKMLLYKAIYNASNTVECIEIRKDDVSGQAFNKTIRLYYQSSVDHLAQLLEEQKAELKKAEDDLNRFLTNPQLPASRKREAALATERRLRVLKVTHAEARLAFIRAQSQRNTLTPYQSAYFDLKIREQHLDQPFEHPNIEGLELAHTFGLAYIYSDAFNDLRERLAYSDEDLSTIDWEDAWAFTDKTDYILKQYDQTVYNSIDGASVALGCFGLDFIADGVGLGYSLFRGDVVQAGGYSVGVLVIGPEGVVIAKASVSALVVLITKNGLEEGGEQLGRRALLKLGQKYADEGVISREAFAELQSLEERELAAALKAALSGRRLPGELPFLSQLHEEALSTVSRWDEAVYLKLEDDLASNPAFSEKFFNLANTDPGVVEAWKAVGVDANLRTNTKFLGNISGYSDDLLKQLNDDLLNPKWAEELKALFKDNPNDVTNIWKQLKEDPLYAWEVSKTGDASWQKWSKREFFKEITAKGKAFERFVESNISSLRTKLLNKYPNLDISQYEIFTQVQIKTGLGSEHFVADIVLVKKKADDFGQIVLDKNHVVVLETKLSLATNLTTPQGNALAKVQSNSNTFEVRSVSKQNVNGFTIMNSDNLIITDFIKVYSDGNGSVISDVVSLK